MFNNENKPRFASGPVLDRIHASPRDLNGSDPNWYGYSIRSRRVRLGDPHWIRSMSSGVYASPTRSSLGANPNGPAPVCTGPKEKLLISVDTVGILRWKGFQWQIY